VQTSARPEHYQMMGRRSLVRAVREADAVLAEISTSFDSLLDVTPVNTDVAWDEFCRGGRAHAPTLRYRMLAVDPELVKRRLYDLPLERLEDPVLALLLRDKRRELDRQLDLLEDRDSERFLTGSLQLYGGVSDRGHRLRSARRQPRGDRRERSQFAGRRDQQDVKFVSNRKQVRRVKMKGLIDLFIGPAPSEPCLIAWNIRQ
ncbi:MAG: tyrosine/phenylalanine carboxypeptidase domain-containing protein, partial [bacterium]